MPTINHLLLSQASQTQTYRASAYSADQHNLRAIKPQLTFSFSDIKFNSRPKPEEPRNDPAVVTEQAVPIASLQLINNIREQKEKSSQLQKRKPHRDQQ